MFAIISYSIYVSAMGVMHCKNLERAKYLEKLGMIYILVILFNAALSAFALNNIWAMHPLILILELILPILYIAGASKNTKAAEAAAEIVTVRQAVSRVWRCAKCNKNSPISVSSCVFCTAPKQQ